MLNILLLFITPPFGVGYKPVLFIGNRKQSVMVKNYSSTSHALRKGTNINKGEKECEICKEKHRGIHRYHLLLFCNSPLPRSDLLILEYLDVGMGGLLRVLLSDEHKRKGDLKAKWAPHNST